MDITLFVLFLAIFGVTLQSFGYLFQKIGLSGFISLKSFFINKENFKWFLGTFLTILGTIFFFISLSLSSITLIQPLVGLSPPIVTVISFIFFGTAIHRKEILGLFFSCLGIIFLSIESVSALIPSQLQIEDIYFFLFSCAIVFTSIGGSYLLLKLHVLDLGLLEGVLAGLFGGLSSVYAKIYFDFVFKGTIIHWSLLLLVLTQIFSFFLLQKGLHNGRVEKVVTLFTSVSILIPVIIGIAFFSESFSGINFLGIIFIVLSIVLLSRNYYVLTH